LRGRQAVGERVALTGREFARTAGERDRLARAHRGRARYANHLLAVALVVAPVAASVRVGSPTSGIEKSVVTCTPASPPISTGRTWQVPAYFTPGVVAGVNSNAVSVSALSIAQFTKPVASSKSWMTVPSIAHVIVASGGGFGVASVAVPSVSSTEG